MSAAKHIARTVSKRLFDPVTFVGTVSSLRIRYRRLKRIGPDRGGTACHGFAEEGGRRAMPVENAACRIGSRNMGFSRRCRSSR
jgi:hypothetical protein